MADRRMARRPVVRKQINWSWAGIATTPTTVAASTKVLLASFVLSTAFDETITRVRGHMSVTSDQAATPQEVRGALGFVRVTDRAVAAGAASIPGPITDIDDDGWFVFVPVASHGARVSNANPEYAIESKAQRIIREGEVSAVMYENASSLDGVIVTLTLRFLSRFRS